MKKLLFSLVAGFAVAAMAQDAGWKPLFDGKSTAGWRGFKKQDFPADRWVIENGTLHCLDSQHGGKDIITDASYGDFDLTFEWKIATNANSGVKYFILEERGQTIGHEYQIIDDKVNADAKHGTKRVTASFYDVMPPKNASPKAVGEWNESRILVHGNHVEHWLNGTKVLEYELGSPEVKVAVAESKFKTVKGFGEKVKGHILLQDHGGGVWFRNVKIKTP